MKYFLLVSFYLSLSTYFIFAQSKIIYTKPLFLRISPDARSSSLADMGVATTPDTFSQYWNPAKYCFSKNYSGVGISYSPYLREITKDTFLLYGAFYSFLDKEFKSILSTSIYYYKGGKAYLSEYLKASKQIIYLGESNAYEFYIDFSYGMKLRDEYSMALVLRYIRSDPFNNLSTISSKYNDYKASNSFALDISGYFESEKMHYKTFDGIFHFGFNLNNIGPKINYHSKKEKKSFYFPTNLKLGIFYDFFFDKENQLSLGIELNKLLVPSPNQYGSMPEMGIFEGIFSSFYKAPGGLKEKLQEINYSFGLEYSYENFKLRSGYFYEAPEKGARKYFSLGLGMHYGEFGFDFSYLIPSLRKKLTNILKISLNWDFGGVIYN